MSDETADVSDAIELVVKRAAVLDCLTADSVSKRDLREDLGVSRSTVYKAVRELEDANLVEESADGCRLTVYGRLFAEQYRSFTETVADIQRHESLLAVLPPDAPVTTAPLVGAERIVAERHAPNRPIARIERLVRNADRVTGFSPVVLSQYIDLFHEEIVSEGLVADLLLEAPVVEYMQSDHAELFAEALDTGRLAVSVTEEPLPFGLVIGEGDGEEMVLMVHDEGGDLRGIIANDAVAALDWSREVFRTVRAGAEQLADG